MTLPLSIHSIYDHGGSTDLMNIFFSPDRSHLAIAIHDFIKVFKLHEDDTTNEHRPHSALEGKTPKEFSEKTCN